MIDCVWLPELVLCDDLSKWTEYEQIIYSIFCQDFIETRPQYCGKPVYIRKHPIEQGKEEAFFHVTCQDYSKSGNRVPDLRRCERIRWVRSFIENYNCDSTQCPTCDGVKVWCEQYKMYTRTHILLEEERYMVVVENRAEFNLLITAFYFDMDHKLEKALKRYHRAQK